MPSTPPVQKRGSGKRTNLFAPIAGKFRLIESVHRAFRCFKSAAGSTFLLPSRTMMPKRMMKRTLDCAALCSIGMFSLLKFPHQWCCCVLRCRQCCCEGESDKELKALQQLGSIDTVERHLFTIETVVRVDAYMSVARSCCIYLRFENASQPPRRRFSNETRRRCDRVRRERGVAELSEHAAS